MVVHKKRVKNRGKHGYEEATNKPSVFSHIEKIIICELDHD